MYTQLSDVQQWLPNQPLPMSSSSLNPADDRMEDAVLTLSEWLVVMEKLVTDWDWEESESDTTGSAGSTCFLCDPNEHRKSVECKIDLMINLY